MQIKNLYKRLTCLFVIMESDKSNNILFDIENKVFLITGGAAGVGAGITRALLSENARHVAFVDIAVREGSLLEAELNNKFGALRAKFIKCDVTDEEQLSAAYGQVLDKYRRLDVVVNNAAVLSSDERLHKRMVDVNFLAVVNNTNKAMALMRADRGGHGGAIVNITALLDLDRTYALPVYSATKAAVLQFSKCIGIKPPFLDTQVRILTVCLGPTDTNILHRQNDLEPECFTCYTTPEFYKQRVESAAMGIIEAIKRGKSGSTWRVANDNPAEDISGDVTEA